MTKLAIKLQQRGQDIQGRIELPSEPLFTLECMAMVMAQFAYQTNQPIENAIQDLYAIATNKVTKREKDTL